MTPAEALDELVDMVLHWEDRENATTERIASLAATIRAALDAGRTEPTAEEIERLARHLYEARPIPGYPWDRLLLGNRDDWHKHARAAYALGARLP